MQANQSLHNQRSTAHRHAASLSGTFATLVALFDHVCIATVGPLVRSHGYTYLLTSFDRFIGRSENIIISAVTARSVA